VIGVVTEFAGDNSRGDPPDPIPNSEVKASSADGTAASLWESRTLPAFLLERRIYGSCVSLFSASVRHIGDSTPIPRRSRAGCPTLAPRRGRVVWPDAKRSSYPRFRRDRQTSATPRRSAKYTSSLFYFGIGTAPPIWRTSPGRAELLGLVRLVAAQPRGTARCCATSRDGSLLCNLAGRLVAVQPRGRSGLMRTGQLGGLAPEPCRQFHICTHLGRFDRFTVGEVGAAGGAGGVGGG
jgi:hypothetical protein